MRNIAASFGLWPQLAAIFLIMPWWQGWPSGGALAFHQCGPGSISAPGVICGLTLLVLYSALRGQSTTSTFEVRGPGTPVFPSHQKPTFDLICE